jgi:hypothetical protein
MTTTETRSGSRFLIHDIVIGLLAGAGVGTIVGLLIAVRVSDNNIITLVGALVGAATGIYMLMWSHRRNEGFITATVVITWILLVASAAWLILLAYAIATFE